MTELKGLSFIGSGRSQPDDQTFQAINPATGASLPPDYYGASEAEVNRACELAASAFRVFRKTSTAQRAAFLRAIADEIEALGDVLLERYVAESGLPGGRAQGERGRTCGQLRLFADTIESGSAHRTVIAPGDPERQPLPKPDLRLRYVGVGPVAVFGPANFPLAFGVAGGDTASALAAGCPVVVKAHSSHPGTSELVGLAVSRAVARCNLPEGVFSLIFGSGRSVASLLVKHPAIQAVGFTGSERVGRQLFDWACSRPQPIPVFAEMSSINPVLLLPGALAERSAAIAEGLYGSVTMGVGQFCTNPGLILLPEGDAANTFAEALASHMGSYEQAPMLNESGCVSYHEGLHKLAKLPVVETLMLPAQKEGTSGFVAGAALFRVRAADFLSHPELHAEVFGPATLLVSCADVATMSEIVHKLGGQLTISVHANQADIKVSADWIADLEVKTGRIVFNGFPTGVEVSPAMVHGGPYPATTDARFTSVGTRSIDRFLRPVCYQDFPVDCLPEDLRA